MGSVTRVAEAPEQERASATKRIRPRFAGLVITLLACIPVAVLLTWPQALGAQRLLGIAQFIAFRAPLALAILCVAIVAAAVFLLFRRRLWLLPSIALGIAIATFARVSGTPGSSSPAEARQWVHQGCRTGI